MRRNWFVSRRWRPTKNLGVSGGSNSVSNYFKWAYLLLFSPLVGNKSNDGTIYMFVGGIDDGVIWNYPVVVDTMQRWYNNDLLEWRHSSSSAILIVTIPLLLQLQRLQPCLHAIIAGTGGPYQIVSNHIQTFPLLLSGASITIPQHEQDHEH